MTMIFQRTVVSAVLFLILQEFYSASGIVHELNKDSLEKFHEGKLLVVIFVDSPTCERCRIQYPFFVAASQAFPSDPEIFFTRVYDPRLPKEWGIAELPALMYYRDGLEEPDFFMVDITVDDIIDEIARRLHGNFGGLQRFYAVELTPQNFQEVVKTPKQSVLLLTYDKDCQEQVKVMEQIAKNFRNDEAILITKLNVDKHRELRDKEFKSRDVPAVFWYKVGQKKTPKRFGGHISVHMETVFINEQTELNRNDDGSLKPMSGRIDSYDTQVLEHADGLLSRDKDETGRLVSRLLIEKVQLLNHQMELGSYYVFLVEKMKSAGNMDILHIQLDDINKKLDEHDMTQKQEDLLKRKRHILYFFLNLKKERDNYKEEQRQKEEKEKKKQEEENRRKAAEEKKKEKKDKKGSYKTKATIHKPAHEEL